ncbi:MAG: TRAP transporter large permease subunit [Spirochaetales bacterium]|jgi:C4-dicarboxylate transporter, DctM subunit|nr:TRAP transporter large permease subunit [Spirochaetales bacterium]
MKLSRTRIENGFSFTAIILLSIFPLIEIIMRKFFGTGVPGSSAYISHLVVWVTFLGGMITSRHGDHLALTAGFDALSDNIKRWVAAGINLVSVAVGIVLSISALGFVLTGFDPAETVGLFPVRIIGAIMPIGYFGMTLRFIFGKTIDRRDRWIPALGIVIGILVCVDPIINILYLIFPNVPEFFYSISDFMWSASHKLRWPVFILLLGTLILGAPLFIILGGITILLFTQSGGSLEVIPNEAYSMLISPSIPAIPLFTLAGFLLSESEAGKRLVRLFRAFFGWIPGGLFVAAVIVCAFFTTFTGASGVTILALGALLSYVLIQNGAKEKFTHGLLTASGSIGLLFPPSLPIILYGMVSQTSIKDMFLGGIIPGLLMVIAISAMGVVTAMRNKLPTTPFKVKEAFDAVKFSAGELLLPIIILTGYFLGIMTIVETSAVAVLYTIILEVFIHKDIKVKDLPKTAMKAVPIIGGVLIILTVARGLSYYIVDAEVPFQMSAWVQANISSKYVFLILLNIALLITGCLMDIFSAIVVVAPLIIPLGEIFGIHPVHLGVIFLANLELGYLTPPVGLNLFLASYRFNEPLVKVYRNVIPFFLILLISVLLITYVPWFSTALLPG